MGSKDYKIYVCVAGVDYLKRVLEGIQTMDRTYQSLDRVYYLIVDMYFTEKEGDALKLLEVLNAFRLKNIVRLFLWFKNGNDQVVEKVIDIIDKNIFLESL